LRGANDGSGIARKIEKKSAEWDKLMQQLAVGRK
jgi:hypothetical protein